MLSAPELLGVKGMHVDFTKADGPGVLESLGSPHSGKVDGSGMTESTSSEEEK